MGAVGFQEAEWIWRDGEFVHWEDANLHLLSTAAHHKTSNHLYLHKHLLQFWFQKNDDAYRQE